MKFLTIFFILIGFGSFALASDNSDFKKIVKTMMDSAAAIKVQQASIMNANENYKSKRLYWTPTASATISNGTSEGDNPVIKGTTFTGNLNLWKFGSTYLTKEAASSRLNAENARMGQTTEDLETTAANLIFQILRQIKFIEIQKKNFELKNESFKLAKDRYKSGVLPEQELAKVSVELESARINLSQAEFDKIQLLNSLKTISNVEFNLQEWPYLSEINSKRKMKLRSVHDFFNVQALKADYDFNHKMAQGAWRQNYLPSLDLMENWSNPKNGTFKNGSWSSALVLTIPLWDQWSGVSKSAEFEASALTAKANSEQAQRQAEASLETLQQRLDLLQSNAQAGLRGVEKLQSLRNDSLRRFRLGKLSVNDLLVDETRFLDAETALLSSMQSYHQLLVEACHNQGESILNCY